MKKFNYDGDHILGENWAITSVNYCDMEPDYTYHSTPSVEIELRGNGKCIICDKTAFVLCDKCKEIVKKYRGQYNKARRLMDRDE